MNSSKRLLRLLATAVLVVLAMLLVPVAVGASPVDPIDGDGLGMDAYYPWREPADVGAQDVGLAAGPYAMYDGTYQYYSEVTFATPARDAKIGLMNIQVKDQLSTPTSVPARGYCADGGTNAIIGQWLPYCRDTSGAVTHILGNYWPTTDEPEMAAGVTLTPAEKTAAVQSAIWRFTDNWILANSGLTSQQVYSATQAIIADAILNAGGTPIASDLVLSPATERNDLNDSTSHTVTARLTDAWGNGVPGERVDFSVKRGATVVKTDFALTDALGYAMLTYSFTDTLTTDIVTDTIYAWTTYRLERGLRFCDENAQDFVLVDPIEIPLEDMCTKEWVQCRDYAAAEVDWKVDCVEETTSYTYLVSGEDEGGMPMSSFAVGLCNLEDIGHDVLQVMVADVADCDSPTPGSWGPEYFMVHAPGNPSNPIPGRWSVEIPANIGQDECKYFTIVISGLWTVDTVPWAGVVSSVCDAGGSVEGPSCTPYDTPNCEITAPDTVCDGAMGNTASVASGYLTYTWNIISGTITSGQGTPIITWDAEPGATDILLEVEVGDIEGCMSDCSKPVTPLPNPVVYVGDQEVCVGETVTLTAVMQDLGDCDENEITYMWEVQDLGGQWSALQGETGATLSFVTTAVGSFNYRVTACCGDCCDMDGAMVTVHPYPAIALVGAEVCVGTPVTLTAVVQDPGECDPEELTYTWYAIVGQTRVLIQGETGATLSVDTSTPGTTTYVVVVCCVDCCDEAEADVIVHPYPVVDLEPVEVCEDEDGQLTAMISTYGDCEPGQVMISWYKKDAAGAWQLLIGENGETLDVDTSAVGTEEYRVVVCCGDCCDEAETTVTVLPLPVVVLYGDEVCLGESATLVADVTDTGDCDSNEMTYTWYRWDAAQWVPIAGETGATLVVTPTLAGTYSYKVEACCDTCCDDDTADVIVDPLPEVTLEGGAACIGGAVTLTARIISPGDCDPLSLEMIWYQWNDSSQQWEEIQGPVGLQFPVTPPAEGTYRYKVEICCDGCCSEAEATVEIYGEPPCWLEGEVDPCAGDDVTFYAAPGGVQYAWSVDSVLQTITTVPQWDWTATTGPHTISVVITDANNCMSECETEVEPRQPWLIIEKWWDDNGNGARETGEVPLGGFEFTVYDDQDNVVFTGVSDDIKGQLSVQLDCGTYRIVESDKDGWVHTTPAEVEITIDLSQEQWLVEFGNDVPLGRPLSIFGLKFWDLNHNGRNETEPVIGGFRVLVEKEDGTVVADITTQANQSWTVDLTETGIYTIREEVKSGWVQTYPTPNGGVYRINVFEVSQGVLGYELLSAEPIDWNGSFDFGNARPMGFKWHDVNANAYVDTNEPMLGNWRIVMHNMAFQLVYSTYTIAGESSPFYGYWFLTQPLPEGDYYVTEVAQEGWQQTYPNGNGYKIHLYEDGSYDLLSAPQRWMDGLSFGNTRIIGGTCPLCVDRVVFQSDREGGNYNIFTMTLEGTNVGQLTSDLADDVSPSWDFVGNKITWATNRDGDFEVYLMDSDGGNKVNVTNMPESIDVQPNMACQWIAFQTNRDGNWEIYKVDPDVPEEQIRLTDNPAVDTAPYWSPDESLIAFQSDRDGNNEIYIMSAEGEAQGLIRITDNEAEDRNPAWLITEAEASALRDDTNAAWEPWIVFESDREHAGQFDLYKVHVDTGELIRLTDDPAGDMDAVGVPYCDLIVFESERDGRLIDIWRMEHDGTDQRNITLGDDGPNHWFDAIDQMSFWYGWVDPGDMMYYANVPLIIQ